MLKSTDKSWHIRDEPPSASWLANKLGISKLLASLLIYRNVSSPESARSFLSPRLGALRDPFLLKDMDRAVKLITSFIVRKKRITVYGDYDADGLTATALLVDFFSRLRTPVSFYIPHRLEEGYSLNESAVRKIAAAGSTGLIITVDCGINSPSEIALAKKLGMEPIITDHHKVPPDFEPVCPTINPLRPDSPFPFRQLSGVGLAFYLAIAIRAHLRETGFFRGRPEPDLKSYLDLVALGTVADIVPLTEENRIVVKSGLRVLMDSQRPGIKALLRVSGIRKDQMIAADDISFKLAPRLNAMGRLGSATRAVHLLTTDNETEASAIADQMNSLNAQRQVMENKIVSESRERIERMEDLQERRTIVLFDPRWHRGVVGIVASKIVEKYHRPTLILTLEGDLLRGSGRSIDGFNLYEALSDLSDLLGQFGGHDHAAGVSLESTKIGEFCDRFEELARKRIDPKDMMPRIEVDAKLSVESINPQALREIEMLLPFGHANPQPIFWSGPLKVISSRVVGNDHLKLKLREKGITFDCIAPYRLGRLI
ncbi:Single-stranded-DNA-specific exonuclease RecJ [subsurface metagenome]